MPTVYDVPQDLLIRKLAEHLRRNPQVSPPAWATFVKTGSHAERPPQDRDWWYQRCASLLRKIYLYGPVGLGELRASYGGRVSIGYSLAHHRDAGSSIIRKALKQLEALGLVTKERNKGRVLTARGRALLDRLSTEVFKEFVKTDQALSRYA